MQALPSPRKCLSILTLVPYKELDYKSGGHCGGGVRTESQPQALSSTLRCSTPCTRLPFQ